MAKGNCEFNGTGGQYFPTVFIHMFLLTAITFGIYSPWALARLLRLKASHTTINGKKVVFKGKGSDLLVILVVNLILTMVTLGIYGSWAICKVCDWRVRNTFVGGKQSRFIGRGGDLFVFYLIHLLILPVLTLGIYSIVGMYRFFAWKEEHTKYGDEKTSFGGGFGGFFKVSFIGWILNLITLNLFTPWYMCMLYRWQVQGLAVGDGTEVKHFPRVKTSFLLLVIFLLLPIFAIIGLSVMTWSLKDKFKAGSMGTVQFDHLRQVKRGSIQGRKIPTKKGAPAAPLPVEKSQKEAIDYEKEIKRLDDLIKMDGNNTDAFFNRAWFYASKGNLDQAVKDYTRAIEINNKLGKAYYNRGLIYVKMEDFMLAVKDFQTASELMPLDVDVSCNRGNANYQLGRIALAIEDYTDALKIKPDDGDIYYNRAIAYHAKGEDQKANSDFKKAESLGNKSASAYLKGKVEKTDKTGSSLEGETGWKEDLTNVKIPESTLKGMIHGKEFTADKATLENGILTIRDGKDFFPDHAVMIFLFLKKGETVEGKSFDVKRIMGFGVPHIHIKWMPDAGNIPNTDMFMKDYSMHLEFETIKNGKIPGKIYLCMPDKLKSYAAGSFTATVK